MLFSLLLYCRERRRWVLLKFLTDNIDNLLSVLSPECDQKFYTRDPRTIIDHVMWRHRDAPRYHCGYCKDDTGFGMIAGFEDHCKKEHG